MVPVLECKYVSVVWYREFYDAGALMLNDEATVVAGLLVGLNIIDCNMVLKGDDDLDRPVGGSTAFDLCCIFVLLYHSCLQCFDAVGWLAGRASGL